MSKNSYRGEKHYNAFIHVKRNVGEKWYNFGHGLTYVPAVGEAFSVKLLEKVPGVGPEQYVERLYRVLGVIHVQFEASYDVELFVEEVDQTEWTGSL